MSTYTQTTKTFKQLAAEFATVFKDIRPVAAPKPVTQAERLAPYRPHILKQRKRGLTWKQIADGMGDPRIGVKVSERVLRLYFANDEKPSGATTRTTAPTTEAVTPATVAATEAAALATAITTAVGAQATG